MAFSSLNTRLVLRKTRRSHDEHNEECGAKVRQVKIDNGLGTAEFVNFYGSSEVSCLQLALGKCTAWHTCRRPSNLWSSPQLQLHFFFLREHSPFVFNLPTIDMPPRIRKVNLFATSTIPSVQTHCRSCFRRALSATAPLNATKLRRQMFAWLRGPGKNFQYPLPDSTNYLSAYDSRGNLLRAVQGSEKPRTTANPDNPDDAALEDVADGDKDRKLEKETKEDLRPFPLNQHFVSESVLSEPLRQEVWKRVKVDGKSVRTVSVELGVEMRRVGAVVRLVEVERRMRADVSLSFLHQPAQATCILSPHHDEQHKID